jgi:hypothetical protein
MKRTYNPMIGDRKVKPLLEKLLNEGNAELVESSTLGQLKIYSIYDPPVTVIDGWKVMRNKMGSISRRLRSAGHIYTVVGREEDIIKFDLLND